MELGQARLRCRGMVQHGQSKARHQAPRAREGERGREACVRPLTPPCTVRPLGRPAAAPPLPLAASRLHGRRRLTAAAHPRASLTDWLTDWLTDGLIYSPSRRALLVARVRRGARCHPNPHPNPNPHLTLTLTLTLTHP